MGYLGSAADANGFLDGTKIKFSSDQDAVEEAKQTDSILRASLRDLYPDKVDLWGDTEDVPPVVSTIAGMLMASLRYSKRYSEEAIGENDYSARMWDRGMSLVTQIRTGDLEVDDAGSAVAFSRTDFWPNDLTTNKFGDPLRFATMEKEF